MRFLFALPLAQTPLGMHNPPFFNVFQPSSSSNLVVASQRILEFTFQDFFVSADGVSELN